MGIHLHIDGGVGVARTLRFCDVLERSYVWVRGIQGFVLVGIHHKTVIRPPSNQGTSNTDSRSCPHLVQIPAVRQETHHCHGSYNLQNFSLHFGLQMSGTGGTLSKTSKLSN